jgi:hypothetical protein
MRTFRCGDGKANGTTALNVEENQPPAARPTALLLSRHPPFPFLMIPPALRHVSPLDEVPRCTAQTGVIGR